MLREQTERATTWAELEQSLENWLNSDFVVGRDGRLLHTRKVVDRIGSIRIVLHSNDHTLPHFHVEIGRQRASFDIRDGRHIVGELDPRTLRMVREWYPEGRTLLVREWNAGLPTDGRVTLHIT